MIKKFSKFLIATALACVAAVSMAQSGPLSTDTAVQQGGFKAQSISITNTPTNFGILYINDGVKGLVGAKITAVSNFLNIPKLSLNAMGVTSLTAGSQYYAGGLLTYPVYQTKSSRFELGLGLKGLNVTNLLSYGNLSDVTFDKKQVVWSAGFTVSFN